MDKLILTSDKQQVIDKNKPILPITINLFLSVTNNHLDKLFITLYSLRKYSKSIFNVYIMTDTELSKELFFRPLINDKLHITFLNDNILNKVLNKNNDLKLTKMAYARLLVPTLFPNLDKMLYLDYDTIIIKEGIEWLYNLDMKDKYLAVGYGNLDCNYNLFDDNVKKEYRIFRTISNFYFNSGIILFNIKKLILDGKDKEMIEMLKNPPNSNNNELMKRIKLQINYNEGVLYFTFYDQSLLNWIFRENVVIKFNKIFNSLEDNLFTVNYNRNKLIKELWEFKSYKDYFNNIVIAHFCGPYKPWIYGMCNPFLKTKYQGELGNKYIKLYFEAKTLLNKY